MGNLIEQRLVLRAAIDQMAALLEGEVREEFVRNATTIMNRHAPAPSNAQKREAFRIVR